MAEEGTSGRAEGGDIDMLLPRGLTPRQVCEEFFKAVWEKDHLRWLATIHIDRRAIANTNSPGPFASVNWELGRARVEKYMVTYKFKHEFEGGSQAVETASSMGTGVPFTCSFDPCYGPVPGYAEGTPLADPTSLVLTRQGGPSGEWRIVGGSFR